MSGSSDNQSSMSSDKVESVKHPYAYPVNPTVFKNTSIQLAFLDLSDNQGIKFSNTSGSNDNQNTVSSDEVESMKSL